MLGAQKKAHNFRCGLSDFGAAGRNRTHDPLVRSQVLYPAELQPQHLWDYSQLLR